MQAAPAQCYAATMRDEQRIIVDWMEAQLNRMGVKPETWANKAGVSPTTITRAMKDEYASVTVVPTLDALAKAAGVPSVLDFLAGEAATASADAARQGTAPLSQDALAPILRVLLPSGPTARLRASTVEDLAAALAHGLESLGVRLAKPANEDAVDVAARAAAARLREGGGAA